VAKKSTGRNQQKKPVAKKEIKWSLILEPINTETLEFIRLTSQQLGSKVVFHTKEQPDLDKINIAVIGVLENRGAGKGTEVVDLSAIRRVLQHVPGNWDASIF
jgi:hypothetical protein